MLTSLKFDLSRLKAGISGTEPLKQIESYGLRMQAGLSEILNASSIPHVYAGHPSMASLFFAEKAPSSYRDWAKSDYTFYEALAKHLHDGGVMCEPDSREPWFISTAHDDECLSQTLECFAQALDATLADRAS